MEDKELNKLRETAKVMAEEGFVSLNPENQDEASLTDKGIKEVIKWKDKHKEMDFLLLLFEHTKEGLIKMFKEKKEEGNKFSIWDLFKGDR